jgi:hypothetical protein
MRNKMRPWTEEDDRRLLELSVAGKSPLSIANALRRTSSAVRNRLTVRA